MAKAIEIKPEEAVARDYADRLILSKLTELQSVVKLSEIADELNSSGLGLATVRALLASNNDRFAYSERRWIPASRLLGEGRPLAEACRLVVERFGGPVPVELLVREIAHSRKQDDISVEESVLRIANAGRELFITANKEVALSDWAFRATDENIERAMALNNLALADVEAVQGKLGADFDWRAPNAHVTALEKAVPTTLKALGAACWLSLNGQDARATLLYDWREFAAEVLSVEGYAFGLDGTLVVESEARKWVASAVKYAEKIASTVEIEDSNPIEIKANDVDRIVKSILASESSVGAIKLLEEFYEITPSVKTFPDDLENLKNALIEDGRAWWVGGDRFTKPNSAPEFALSVPEPFIFPDTTFEDEEGDFIDSEISDEGLSSTLRKLITHPLAMDVLDEETVPLPRQQPESLRLVLKPIHRELGTFPMCQIAQGWFDVQPPIQEAIFIDDHGRETQVWINHEARLMYNLFDWFLEQPIESGAVFSLTKTTKPNVFEFQWLDQTDPVVFISSQRMEELRDIQARSEEMSTLQLLQEVMSHWPKGADFLTILWELNVIRRVRRRLVASLLTNYLCFYQRSGSPVWHYDAKKVELGFDKTKRKFIVKR